MKHGESTMRIGERRTQNIERRTRNVERRGQAGDHLQQAESGGLSVRANAVENGVAMPQDLVRKAEVDALRTKLEWLEGSLAGQWMERLHKEIGSLATREDVKQIVQNALWPVTQRLENVPSKLEMQKAVGEAVGVAVAAAFEQCVNPLLCHIHDLAERNDYLTAQNESLRTLADASSREREWLEQDLQDARFGRWFRRRRRRNRDRLDSNSTDFSGV